MVWFKYNYKNWMHSFEVSLGHESVDRTTFSTSTLHWKCTSVNAFIPQWNFKRMHSILKWNQLWHTKMLDGIYTWELIELFTLVSENHIMEYSVFIVLILCLKISVAFLSRNCVLNPKGYAYFVSVVLRVSTQKSKNK